VLRPQEWRKRNGADQPCRVCRNRTRRMNPVPALDVAPRDSIAWASAAELSAPGMPRKQRCSNRCAAPRSVGRSCLDPAPIAKAIATLRAAGV
jgi:hypothetical protein